MESLPLLFQTKQVKFPNDLGAHIWEAGGIIAVASGILLRRSQGDELTLWALIGVGAGLLLVLLGLAIRRGKKARTVVLDTEIVVSVEEIRIGDQIFAVDKVEYLDFLVNSYKGMSGIGLRSRRLKQTGMDNKLSFIVEHGQRHCYGFYLEDAAAIQRLGLLFGEFYQKKVRFRERNRGGRTFLFQQVLNQEQFEAKKRSHGYA